MGYRFKPPSVCCLCVYGVLCVLCLKCATPTHTGMRRSRQVEMVKPFLGQKISLNNFLIGQQCSLEVCLLDDPCWNKSTPRLLIKPLHIGHFVVLRRAYSCNLQNCNFNKK